MILNIGLAIMIHKNSFPQDCWEQKKGPFSSKGENAFKRCSFFHMDYILFLT